MRSAARCLAGTALLVGTALACAAADRGRSADDKRKIAEGVLGDMGVHAYVAPDNGSCSLALVLTRGVLPERHDMLQAEDFTVRLLLSNGNEIRPLKPPPSGPLDEVGSPSISVNLRHAFAGPCDRSDVKDLEIQCRDQRVRLPVKREGPRRD